MATILPARTRVKLARRAGRVQRYHTQRLLFPETVAEHTFNMLNLLFILCNGRASHRLVSAILTHDMGEYHSGDMPSPVKKAMPPDAKAAFAAEEDAAMMEIHPHFEEAMTEPERWLFKLIDNLDGLLKSTEEVRMGNYTMELCGTNYARYVYDVIQAREHDHIWLFCTEALEAWEKVKHDQRS